MYSNYLVEEKLEMEPYIQETINKIVNNPMVLSNCIKSIDFTRNNADRIEKILSYYVDLKIDDLAHIYECTKGLTRTSFLSNKFRTFLKYEKENGKNILYVIMFDPYHLVCPVEHNSFSKDEMKEKIFNKVKKNEKDFKFHFDHLFKKIDFEK